MAAVLGLSPDAVRGICERLSGADPDHPVVAALLNGPENVVVSGAVQGVEAAERLAAEAGARKVTRLTVSSAFHSPLMAEAVAEWRAVVAGAQLREPGFPVVLNTTGAVATGADDARQALVDQLTGPVRWMEGVRAAVAAGADLMVEAGDSKVLSALVRAIDPGLPCLAMHDPRALRRLVPAQGQPGEPLAGSVAR
jgi:[acyl-carrier-protein] S-malonyltransferase